MWFDRSAGIALGHTRLSILDVSPAGHQPMTSHCGRYVIVFNGEIYNHPELRQRLEPRGSANSSAASEQLRWRGHSDTEVFLEYVATFGILAALNAAVGMFAFALWDKQTQILHLSRDRMGEKPIYYGWVDQTFAFGSELKLLRALPNFDNQIDRAALALYMRHSCVPAPRSIYEDIFKLPPGSYLSISRRNVEIRDVPKPQQYWDLLRLVRKNVADAERYESVATATASLDMLLRESIAGQMVADVPLGALLSGGVDSSTVVALMQAQSSRAVKTFSIGFHEEGFNEARHAKAVAQHLGTDHMELYVNAEATRDVIPKLPEIFCEPFGDSSQIPTFLVSQLARREVTVALSGDGGDELFGGYGRYFLALNLWRTFSRTPELVRTWLAAGIRMLPVAVWDALTPLAGRLLPSLGKRRLVGQRLHKGAGLLGAESSGIFYRDGFVTHWNPSGVVLHAREPETALTAEAHGFTSFAEQMMALDATTYLPDDVLVKVDRAAMAVSLETRVPFLDHRVVEFAFALPLSLKIRDGQGKWLLRQVLSRYVPTALTHRPKAGFSVPIDSWLRGPLRDWAESLLSEARLRAEGFLNPAAVHQKWREHLAGRQDWQYLLWDVLMFQAWLEREQHAESIGA